ncbi:MULTISPECIES: hypothetical protein [unclassified Burkholderia]|uniref:hypothetical protein n=1 Tax=unclassified Burkholderia TaxID=2613784 RepID=UPI000F5807F8|nr:MULTISPECIES: hypothetical protein [unclassified Burkholderia]
MTPAQREAIVRDLSTQARKVFEFVPGAAAWTSQQIMGCMYDTTKSRMELRAVAGCLASLVDAGIVKETSRGHFQRSKVSVSRPQPVADAGQPATPVVEPVAVSEPIDVLSGILGRLSRVAADIHAIASDLETAALRIDEQRENREREVGKLRQLQALLKEL